MAGWNWVECTINAPAKNVFEFFADDSDKLPYLVPSASVVRVLEREKLPNGGQRTRAIINVGFRQLEVASEDTEYVPFTLLRCRETGPSMIVESERRFSEVDGRTRLISGSRVVEQSGFLGRLSAELMPAYGELSTRLARLGMLARARAALEPVPQPQAVTDPAWIRAQMPPPVTVGFGWVRWAVLATGLAAGLTAVTLLSVVWPPLAQQPALEAATFFPFMAVLLIALQAASWVALRFVPISLPDTRR